MIEERFRPYLHNVFRADIYPDCFIFFESADFYVATYTFTEAQAELWMALWELTH